MPTRTVKGRKKKMSNVGMTEHKFADMCLFATERLEEKKRVITPGGRVGDDASHNRSPKKNWIEKRGGLPAYIRTVRNGIMKNGVPEGKATALAIAAVRRWAAGKGDVSPAVRAAAEKAVAQYEAMRSTKSNESSFHDDWSGASTMLAATTETKGSTTMQMEHKSVGVSGLNVVDETKGIVETIVSVTGIVDNVKDIIEPGAYTKSLNTRIPKGVWSHSWDTPVARTEEVKELMPGDERLPSQLPNGQPWPDQAGALLVKTQFNLGTQRGREAYSDVTFFGDQQEWSIGYQVPVGGATVDSKTGQRRIQTLELYEYSPVLFGAMPHARSLAQTGAGVKDAQIAFKTLTMPELELKEWASGLDIDLDAFAVKSGKDDESDDEEVEDLFLSGDEDEDENAADDESDPDEEEPDADEDDEDEEKSLLTAYEREILVKTFQNSADLLGIDISALAYKEDDPDAEADADSGADDEGEETASLSAVAGDYKEVLEANDLSDMIGYAQDFDTAVNDQDADAAQEAGNAILDMIEGQDDPDADLMECFQNVARAIADLAPEAGSDEEEPTPEDEDDTEKKEEKSDTIVIDTKSLDALRAGLF